MTASRSRAFPPSACFISLFITRHPKWFKMRRAMEIKKKDLQNKHNKHFPRQKNFSQFPTPLVPKTGLFWGGFVEGAEERMFMLASFLGCELSHGSAFLTQSMTKGMWTIWTKPLATMALHTQPKEAFHSLARTLISICFSRVNHHFDCYQLWLAAFVQSRYTVKIYFFTWNKTDY